MPAKRKYVLVTATFDEDVELEVNQLSGNGYELYGDLVVVSNGHDADGYLKRRYYQWMKLKGEVGET